MEDIRKSVKKASQLLRKGISAPDFWAFVRSLENADKTKPRLGRANNPGEENVRFGQMPYLYFPTTDIAEIIEGGKNPGVDATLIVYFFGLLGVSGPMPLEFTNYIFRRSHSYFDNTWRRFLDIIHHRFLSFYYRAFAANQQAISADRPEDDVFADIIGSLAGLPPGGGESAGVMLDSARYFSMPVKNRWGLEDILRRTFISKLRIEEFVPAANDIPPENYAVLGKRNTVLGFDLQIGRSYISLTGKFEIHIGPLSFEEYQGFMRGSNGLARLSQVVDRYLDRPLDYSVVFSVIWHTIPLAQLGFDLVKKRWEPACLGYTGWIGNQEDREVILSIPAVRLNRGKHIEKEKIYG
ncbi:type VI secretion system baseplate subunit TssG [Treponema primitia]|uniref:type VI secretion system baseplate subunit TssG n=1 Tax=Treponema primitia TaxID=88058 RepID=UPI00397F2807